ncbi:MAG: LamG-like jellyroll fold domain-containing protein [Caldilineaceae bacterium]
MKPIISSASIVLFAAVLTLLTASPASAGGVVTDCTTYGPGPGTLATAVETDGLVTFACSGTIAITEEIPLPLPGRHLAIDASGQNVILSGRNENRIFNVGPKSSLQLRNVTLMWGNAGANGGGAIQSAGILTITNSALLSNTAAYGGALEIMNGALYVQNSTLAGNQALDTTPLGGGGVIDIYFSPNSDDGPDVKPYTVPSVVIQNSTVVNNRSARPNRDGIWQENGQMLLSYNVIAHNGAGNCSIDAPDKAIQFRSTGNLDTDGTCSPAVQADPALLPLGYYGANTPMFALQANSPAIDAAPASACTGMVDQRSVIRPRDGNRDGTAGCDLGAYEYGDRYVVAASNSDGLAGYWKFDEAGGATSLDAAGHNLTAALQNGATFSANHAPLHFVAPYALQTSLGAGVLVNDAPALNPVNELTVAAWVRLNSTGGTQPIASKLADGGVGPGYALLVRDGMLSAEAWDLLDGQHVITSSITAGAWLHVAMTYKTNGEMAAYINGRLVGTEDISNPLGIGSAPLQMAVDGILDDVRVYNRALTAGGVAALAGGRSCVSAGTTWSDAVPDLQCALLEAAAGSEVWIGPGVYRPTRGPERSATFAVGDGVGVYGGFAGTETRRDQRQASTARPVLSGDIEANDRVNANGVITDLAGIAGGNALHVVSINSAQASTVLEGVIVTGGMANGAAESGCAYACGGGLYVTAGAPQLRNISLVSNYAGDRGGGLYAAQGAPTIMALAAQGNQAAYGGGVFLQDTRAQVVNTLLAGNYALANGGGFYAANSSVRMVNVTAAANRAGGSGGGLLLEGGASIVNALIGGNGAASGSQLDGSAITVQYSLVQDGCSGSVNCADHVQTGDPLLVSAPSPAAAPTSLGDFHAGPTSPVLDIGYNDAAFDPSLPEGATISAITQDLGGSARIVAVRVTPAQIDLGAYEAANIPPVFLTKPNSTAGLNADYVYTAIAEDPNQPGVRLPIVVTTKPQWLSFAMQSDGSGKLQGTPPKNSLGAYDVILRATDSLGAVGQQYYVLQVKYYAHPIFLPQVLVYKKR